MHEHIANWWAWPCTVILFFAVKFRRFGKIHQIIFLALISLKPFVSFLSCCCCYTVLFLSCFVVCSSRTNLETHAHTQTHRQNDYHNPHCVYAPRVNNFLRHQPELQLLSRNSPILLIIHNTISNITYRTINNKQSYAYDLPTPNLPTTVCTSDEKAQNINRLC